MSKAKVFFVEGSDYSGKTTLIQKLSEYLIGQGHSVLLLKEPISPLRDVLLGKDYDFGFAAKRFLFAGSHTYLMDIVFKSKGDYDFILIDRTSVITDAVYSSMEMRIDLKDKDREGLFSICKDMTDAIKQTDKTLFDNFFSENSYLILLDITKSQLINRINRRKVDTDDRYDSLSSDYKIKVWQSYSDIARNIADGDDSLKGIFKNIYIVNADDNPMSLIIKNNVLKGDVND